MSGLSCQKLDRAVDSVTVLVKPTEAFFYVQVTNMDQCTLAS